MSIRRRRLDSNERLNDIIYNTLIRTNERKKYTTIRYTDLRSAQYCYDHTDYVVLSIVVAYRNRFIDKKTCLSLIDKVEGYFYAFESGLIDSVQLCTKLNHEIMIEELNKKDWNKLGVFRDDMYKR